MLIRILARALTVPAVALTLAAAPARAQVIRSYEGLDRSAGDGRYLTVQFDFDASAGNTDYLQFDVSSAVGYKGATHWLRLYPALRIRRSGGETEEDQRSAHLRYSYIFSPRTRTFSFVQVQADRSLDVIWRFIAGGGLRRVLVEGVDGGLALGVGAMWEDEELEDGTRESGVRGTNLLSLHGKSGIVTVGLVTFFQPLLRDWGDHRVAMEGSASVPLGSRLSLEAAVRMRRDSRPPTDVEPNDLNMSIGLRYAWN